MRTKISAQKAFAVFSEVPTTLRALAVERDEALQKLAAAQDELHSYHLRERVEKIASEMESKNIQPGLSTNERRELLMKKAEEGRLDAVEQAVEMAAPERALGFLGEVPGNGADQLTSYLLGDLAAE